VMGLLADKLAYLTDQVRVGQLFLVAADRINKKALAVGKHGRHGGIEGAQERIATEKVFRHAGADFQAKATNLNGRSGKQYSLSGHDKSPRYMTLRAVCLAAGDGPRLSCVIRR